MKRVRGGRDVNRNQSGVRNQGDKSRSGSQPEMGPTVGLRGPIAGPPRTEQESEGKWQNPTTGECMAEQEKATGAMGEG